MGCMPNLSRNRTSTEETDHTTGDIIITSALFVKQGNGEPYEHYNVISLLGEGSFGKVYKVRHKKIGQFRAIKVIDKKRIKVTKEVEKLIQKEINIIKDLDHPNIVKIYEFFNTDRELCIINELCTGGELLDAINKQRIFPEVLTAHIMRQILSAVRFCHLNNIVHRDIKPENILLETPYDEEKNIINTFNIKLIDFGLSEYKLKGKLLKEQLGTLNYMAPEVFNNNYNEKCDLWSCGIIMYILLCGQHPFMGESDGEVIKKIQSGKYNMNQEIWKKISSEAQDLMQSLLLKDAKNRLDAKEALDHKWFELLEREKVNNPSIFNFKTEKNYIQDSIINMTNFQTSKKLQDAVLTFIIHNFSNKDSKEDFVNLRNAFLEFDINSDGRLTKSELVLALMNMMTFEQAADIVDKIMNQIDVDKNGYIEYEEFLKATFQIKKLLTEENLKLAFMTFDRDSSGTITYKEIKFILGTDKIKSKNDKIWKQMVADFDINGDGEISFPEFKEMMYKLLNN